MLFDQGIAKLEFTQQYPAHHEQGLENPGVLEQMVSESSIFFSSFFKVKHLAHTFPVIAVSTVLAIVITSIAIILHVAIPIPLTVIRTPRAVAVTSLVITIATFILAGR